jgi:hypothetical protein
LEPDAAVGEHTHSWRFCRRQLAKLSWTQNLQDRLKHILVLHDRLGRAIAKSIGQPVVRGLTHRVVRVTGLRDDPLVELSVQLSELVHDDSLGLAADGGWMLAEELMDQVWLT